MTLTHARAAASTEFANQSSLDLGEEKTFTGVQKFVKGLPTPARLAVCGTIVVLSGGTGYAVGARLLPPLGQFAGALVLGGAGAAAAHVVNQSGIEAASTELHNALLKHHNLRQLRREEVDAVAAQYGVKVTDPRVMKELKEIYERFVTGVIPPGNDDLRGDEAETILRFKSALQLEDDEAAAVHMEIGRRLFRQRLETGDKETAVAERKTFQKLVYVSQLVFGEASKFLLPWKRIFKVSESQVDVAMRENALRLFQSQLASGGAETDLDSLRELRKYQLRCKLPDEVAANAFEAAARERIEGHVTKALEIVKARTRVKDLRKVTSELDAVREYNSALAAVSKKAAAGELVPGVGPVSLTGGETGRAMDDLKVLYQTYLSEALSDGRLEDSDARALTELRNVFGLGKREAEAITTDVTTKVYKRLLAEAVSGGALERAPSKAEFLEDLCDRLQFDPELAAKVHEAIYRQKLEQCVKDKTLSDDDVSALLRLRVFLCIPQSVVDAAHTEICGRIFTKVVDEALGAGTDGYDADMKRTIQQTSRGLRLSPQIALELTKKAVKGVFISYVRRAKGAGSAVETARELKKLVLFSNLTVSELLDDIRGGSGAPVVAAEAGDGVKEAATAAAAAAEEADGYEDESPMMQSLAKTRGPAKEGKAQREITLGDELDARNRSDLYQAFLVYCIQGEQSGVPMGTLIRVKRDMSDFTRLGQLGDILGMSPVEQAQVHQGLAEKAFKAQAQTLLADGQLSPARSQQLKAMAEQFGLPDEVARKVIQGITSGKMAGAIDQAVQRGQLTVKDIRELKESGVDIQAMVNVRARTHMFQKLVEKSLSDGTGEFDREEVYKKLPADLGLDPQKMVKEVTTLAKERLRGNLVSAAALLRQKKSKEVVGVLNNLLACDKAAPSPGPLAWAVREELLDLYSLYLTQPSPKPENKQRLRELLGIDESTGASLEEVVQSGSFSFDSHHEENFVF